MEMPHPYTRCLGGIGRFYLTECLKPIADTFGRGEFSFCDAQRILASSCISVRKMFSQMKDAGFICKQKNRDKYSKANRYVLHPDTFRIIEERVVEGVIIKAKIPELRRTVCVGTIEFDRCLEEGDEPFTSSLSLSDRMQPVPLSQSG